MTTLAANSNVTLALTDYDSVTISCRGPVIVEAVSGLGLTAGKIAEVQGTRTFGPFTAAGSLKLTTQGAATEYEQANGEARGGAVEYMMVNGQVAGLAGPGGATIKPSIFAGSNNKPMLVIGGDHPYSQWYGTTGRDGVAQMNLDAGVASYLAVNTATQEELTASGILLDPVGIIRRLTWDQIRELEQKGVEIVSHGHRHPTSWERLNTGIRIRYTGAAATAPVNIDTTSFILIGNGGAENVTLLYATYPTLATMAAAINATPNWSAVVAPELTGNEPSRAMLKLSAPRNVKASTASQYFAAGGGIVIDYQPGAGSNYSADQCTVRRVGTPSALKIMIGGVVKVSVDLTVVTTLAGVVSAITAASVFGLRAHLTNNNIESVTRENYLQGDELSSGLPSGVSTAYTLPVGHQRAILTGGMGQQYCVARQLLRSKFDLAAQGLNVTQFAQSGADCLPLTIGALTEYDGARIDPVWLNPIYPNAMPMAALAKGDWYPHFCAIYASWSTPESLIAITKALEDSGPWYVNMLVHSLLADGSSDYEIINTDPTPYYDQTESNWKAFLADLKSRLAAKSIVSATPSDARKLMAMSAAPGNLVFNPRFQNAGAAAIVTGVWNAGTLTGSQGARIPGWHFASDSAAFSAVAVMDDGRGDGAGKIKYTGLNASEALMLEQVFPLEPGVYEFGVQVECGQNWVSGGYVALKAQPMWAAFDKTRVSAGGVTGNYVGFGGVHNMTVRVVIEPSKHELPAAFGKAGPYDLSVNNQLVLQFGGKTATAAITVSGATPAVTTASEVASAINVALAANATYGYGYRNCATVEQGKVVVRDVEHYEPNNAPGLVITGTARDAVFGGEVLALSGMTQNAGPLVPIQVKIIGLFGGDAILSQPYMRKVGAI